MLGLNIGHPPRHDLRDILDAVLYVARTGIPKAGIFEHLNALLRRRVREDEGRRPEPTAMVIDVQSIKTSTNVPAAGQGVDVGKKIDCHEHPGLHRGRDPGMEDHVLGS